MTDRPTRLPVPGGKVIEAYWAVCAPAFSLAAARREAQGGATAFTISALVPIL